MDLLLNYYQKIIPKLTFGSPIEDLSPKINRRDFKKYMQIDSVKSDKNVVESN